MGVKTVISLEDIHHIFPCTSLVSSHYGVSDTVYLTDLGVLKLFESASQEAILVEKHLLLHLSSLPISKHSSDIVILKNKPCVMYEKISGKSLEKAANHHIVQISKFIRDFHTRTAELTSTNTQLFDVFHLASLIDQTRYLPFQEIFDSIDLDFTNDGVIHGDLFLDNVLFDNDLLSGVLDFVEACEGDFLFDLAVVAISWCLDGEDDHSRVALLLTHYNAEVTFEKFIPYMKYALLYYATTRYLDNRNYQALLDQIPLIDSLRGAP